MISAALFDYDGTLMDTAPIILESYRYLFRKYRNEEEFTPDRQLAVQGPPLRDMMVQFFPEQDPDRLVQEYRTYQQENLYGWVKPFPGAFSVLDWLKDRTIPVGIISTRYTKSMRDQLELLHMTQRFDVLIGHEDVTHPKPDPEGINKACERLGLDPRQRAIIYVGDSVTDIQAGQKAGAYTVAMVSEPRREKDLQAVRPDAVIRDLRDLIPIFSAQL